MNVLHRSLKRVFHETAIYDDCRKTQISLSFFMLYFGVSDIAEKFKTEFPTCQFCPVEFHQEYPSHQTDPTHSDLPQPIRTVYDQIALCLKTMVVPFETPFVTGKREVEDLIQMLYDLPADEESVAPYLNYGRKSEWKKFCSGLVERMAEM